MAAAANEELLELLEWVQARVVLRLLAIPLCWIESFYAASMKGGAMYMSGNDEKHRVGCTVRCKINKVRCTTK